LSDSERLGGDVARAVAALRRGDAVVYPTETIYGIGVDARSNAAVERLIDLKGREASKGISVLVAGRDAISPLIAGPPPAEALALMTAFWPGPLTIVLPAAAEVSPALIGPAGGVGLRCAADPTAAQLLDAFDAPLTSTSANPAGATPAATADEALVYFGERVAYYLDGGARTGSVPSTVVEFCDGSIHLRRVGAISTVQLQAHVELAGAT